MDMRDVCQPGSDEKVSRREAMFRLAQANGAQLLVLEEADAAFENYEAHHRNERSREDVVESYKRQINSLQGHAFKLADFIKERAAGDRNFEGNFRF